MDINVQAKSKVPTKEPNREGFWPPIGHMKTEVQPVSEKLWFKITWTMDKVQHNTYLYTL
jgi:hypothetical protein